MTLFIGLSLTLWFSRIERYDGEKGKVEAAKKGTDQRGEAQSEVPRARTWADGVQ